MSKKDLVDLVELLDINKCRSAIGVKNKLTILADKFRKDLPIAKYFSMVEANHRDGALEDVFQAIYSQIPLG